MIEKDLHETVQALLPWYVNDTLEDAERQLVEAHVHACLTCRLELKKERQLGDFVRTAPTIDLSPEAGFARLNHSLDASRNRGTRHPENRLWSGWLGLSTGSRVALATFAIAAVAVLLWGTLPRPATVDEPGDVTLSGGASTANHLDVIFAERVTDTQIRGLLAEINGSIVEGPTEIGRYTVRLDDPALDDERLRALIRDIIADERVQFAGPATLGEPQE